jgi:hypothetical protein
MKERQKKEFRPSWEESCMCCGQTPVVGAKGDMCGPCFFGTAEAVNGGWWDDGADDFDEDFVEDHIPARKG